MQWGMYILSVGLGGCLLALLWTRKLMQSMLTFVALMTSLSGIYILTGAPFVGALQLMVYVGGLLVLMAFGIVLMKPEETHPPLRTPLLIVVLAASLLYGWQANLPISSSHRPSEAATLTDLGLLLMGSHGILLELMGLLLLVVLVGIVKLLSATSSDPQKRG